MPLITEPLTFNFTYRFAGPLSLTFSARCCMSLLNLIPVMGGSVLALSITLLLTNRLKAYWSLGITALLAVSSSLIAIDTLRHGTLQHTVDLLPLLGPISFRVDALSAVFILIVNFTMLMASIYGIGYMRQYSNKLALSMHFITYNLLHIAMLQVCMVQEMLPFLIMWELMSVSSFLLVIFEYEKPDVLRSGLNYLVQMHIGVVFLIAAFLILQTQTGADTFDSLRGYFATHNNFGLFLLFFVGFGIKAGFVPLHSWLPHAHPAAPSHVSGVMSGVMIKMGIYGILRILGYVQDQQAGIGYFILAISLLTGVYGIVNAIMQRDLKRMLAFHSLENIGIIGIGIGLGMIGLGIHDKALAFMGFAGGILHVFNHSLFKSQLFFGAGSVYTATHTRNIEQLGGLIKKMPWTGAFFLIASLSISGLPPFNGFISEFLIYKGMLGALNAQNITTEVYLLVTIIALVLIGGMAVYAFTKAFGLIFTGVERSGKTAQAVEVNGFMLAPQVIITAVIIAIGLFPVPFLHLVSLPIAGFLPDYQPALASSTGMLQQVGRGGAVFLVLVGAIFGIRTYVVRKNGEEYGPTWGCGYLAGNSRMQYTDASFVDYFAKLASFMVGFSVTYTPIARPDIFPADRPFETHVHDTIERTWLQTPLRWIAWLLDKLTFLQRGQMQAYLLYGIVFIVVMVIITVLNVI